MVDSHKLPAGSSDETPAYWKLMVALKIEQKKAGREIFSAGRVVSVPRERKHLHVS
jgi:hypothetical protein